MKSVKQIRGFHDFYINNILHGLKTAKMNYKIALQTSSSFVTQVMTDLLTELGCEVRTDGDELIGTKDSAVKNAQESLINSKTFKYTEFPGIRNFCNNVKHNRLDLGVYIEDSCEKMLLVDAKGRLVTEDIFIALISLVLFKTIKGGTVVVPLSASQVVEKIADEYQGSVVRTKTSASDIMGRLLGKDAKEELLEQFTMHFDSIAGLVKLLDFMSANHLSLSALVDMIPEIHMHRQEVECNWNSKGKVIRKLIQEHIGGKVETLEGVKIHSDRGWVLVLPDAEKPVCSVIGESINAEFAEELTNIYVRKVRDISRS